MDVRPLRILILSTPKTGNTWLLNLLSAIYDLPKVGLVYPFDRDQAVCLGDRWIAFHHMVPEPALLSWIDESKPHVLTTIRHPGDVLISLYHHLHSFESAVPDLPTLTKMLSEPFERRDIDPYAYHTFYGELECSLAWMRLEMGSVVRYEDLRRAPRNTLKRLTDRVEPVADDRIEQSIARCDLKLMRSLAGKHKAFFRVGAVGEWRETLSPEILAILASPPYAQQLKELGYTLDPTELGPTPESDVTGCNPFNSLERFDNGVFAAPIIVDFYLSLDPKQNQLWPPIASSGPRSFLAWCNESSDVAGRDDYSGVPLSRLAHYIYRMRPDLQIAFPDLTCAPRVEFVQWFLRQHHRQYLLESYFTGYLSQALLTWAAEPSSLPGKGLYSGVPLPRFALHVYNSDLELQRAFPDLTGIDRASYAEWFVGYEHDTDIARATAVSMKTSFEKWGNSKYGLDVTRRPWWPRMTNYAAYVYESLAGVRQVFPDMLVENRWSFLEWLVDADHGLQVSPGLIDPIRRDLHRLRPIRRWLRRVAGTSSRAVPRNTSGN